MRYYFGSSKRSGRFPSGQDKGGRRYFIGHVVATVCFLIGCALRITPFGLILLLFALPGCLDARRSVSDLPLQQPISFETSDRYLVEGILYPVSIEESPPGLLFVGGIQEDMDAWHVLATRTQRAGYLGLIIPLREDEEAVHAFIEHAEDSIAPASSIVNNLPDIEHAIWVLAERGADPDNIILVGSSEGANLVLLFASMHTHIPAVILISPGIEYDTVNAEEAMQAYELRPVLMLTSEFDAYSASSSRALAKLAPGFAEVHEYAGSAHGLDLLHRSEAPNEQVLLFLRQLFEGIGAER